uniref:Uncharacterized protein n=1 Tax=Varanus komodoensis TaxID=61221 RepID=A0A8D2JAT4_VARKO
MPPSTRPVGLPCASCAWKTSRTGPGRGASPSTSVDVSLDLPFFLPLSPSGILRSPACTRRRGSKPPTRGQRHLRCCSLLAPLGLCPRAAHSRSPRRAARWWPRQPMSRGAFRLGNFAPEA